MRNYTKARSNVSARVAQKPSRGGSSSRKPASTSGPEASSKRASSTKRAPRKPAAKPTEKGPWGGKKARSPKPKKTTAKPLKPKAEDVGPGGRPTLYREEYAGIAERLCQQGFTESDLARAFDVDLSTIYNWRAQVPEFFKALRAGADEANERVEYALYQRAVGYDHPETKVFCSDGVVTTHTVMRHIPPDVGAAKHWLRYRKPMDWAGDGAPETSAHETLKKFFEQVSNGPSLVELNKRRLLRSQPEVEQTMGKKKEEEEA